MKKLFTLLVLCTAIFWGQIAAAQCDIPSGYAEGLVVGRETNGMFKLWAEGMLNCAYVLNGDRVHVQLAPDWGFEFTAAFNPGMVRIENFSCDRCPSWVPTSGEVDIYGEAWAAWYPEGTTPFIPWAHPGKPAHPPIIANPSGQCPSVPNNLFQTLYGHGWITVSSTAVTYYGKRMSDGRIETGAYYAPQHVENVDEWYEGDHYVGTVTGVWKTNGVEITVNSTSPEIVNETFCVPFGTLVGMASEFPYVKLGNSPNNRIKKVLDTIGIVKPQLKGMLTK